MVSHFEKDFFIENRNKLKALIDGEYPIVVTANGLLQRSADTAFPFRQDSNFWYLTGINYPDVTLVIDKEKEYLIVPARSTSRETFDGSLDSHELSGLSGISNVYDDKTGWDLLKKSINKSHKAATITSPKPYVLAHGMFTNPARNHLNEKLCSFEKSLKILDLRKHLAEMRMVKQSVELRVIQEAVNLTTDTLATIKANLSSFAHEYEIEAAVSHSFNANGYSHAYAPIVASGLNGCTLHYTDNKSKLRKSDLILMDVGAEVSLYAADITRTYAVAEPTKRQLSVWQAVLDVQDFSKQLLKPGADIRSLEKQVESFMGEKLIELGLIKTITSEAIRTYYPHATSHFLGLDVHDVADYERVLEPGMVLTVEPGIYIPEESIGIRIEDNIVITDKGIKVLSENLSREL